MFKGLNKFHYIGLGILGAGFLSLLIIGIVAMAGGFGNAGAIEIPTLLGAFLFLTFILYALKAIVDRRNIYAQLELENLYTLGHRTRFYNIYQFTNRVRAVRNSVRLKGKKQFLISFSFAPLSITSNPRHNEEVSNLNYVISEFLTKRFHGDKKGPLAMLHSNVFCFHRGEFLLYDFAADVEEVKALASELSDEIYKIGVQEKARVLIQPFFGVYEADPHDNLTLATDNAQIARSFGEEAFETLTFYHDSFRISSSKDEIAEIEAAIDNQELVVFYQPKYSIKEKRFISSEALVRWNSPKYGLLSPASFIEKAENAGLISQIDLYVFEHTLIDLAEALKRGRRVMPVSVNFSLYEFFSPNFLQVFTGLLEKYKVPPTLVEVEITETTSQANQFMSISIIKKLKDKGVRVLMDDFGIGYSGIDNLRKIPFDAIKIDKSFTDLLVEDEKTRSIIKLIIELGHSNDIEVIIEGVDNAAQVEILRRLKIDTIQGFFYSKPLPLDQYEVFLRTNGFEGKGARS